MKTQKILTLSALYAVFINLISVNAVICGNQSNINGTWNELEVSGNLPPSRSWHSSIYDSRQNRMIIFGGWSSGIYDSRNDTWTLDLSTDTWSQLSTIGGPPPTRAGTVTIYDSLRNRMIVFGGDNWWVTSYNDTWALDLTTNTWSQLTTSGTPPSKRFAHCGIYDTQSDRLIIFGGIYRSPSYVYLNDTWALDFATLEWQQLNTTNNPFSGSVPTAIYDKQNNRMIIFGVREGGNSRTYELDLSSYHWTQLDSIGYSVWGHTTVLDPQRRLMIASSGTGFPDSTQAAVFSLYSNTWLNFSVSGEVISPSRGDGGAGVAVWDPYKKRAVVFGGGINLTTDYNDTWELLLSETATVTDIDGNVYQTVKIGNQLWMAENLKVTHYRNGDPIPNVTDDGTWAGLSTGAYCNYNNDEGNVDTYGRLYNWYAVDDSRNIAPEGWHVPTDREWKQLEMYLGISQSEADADGWRGTDEGGKLKEAGTIHWNSPNTGATNETGFSALPSGFRHFSGFFNNLNDENVLWTSTESSSNEGWYRSLSYEHSDMYRGTPNKKYGFTVRCIKNFYQTKTVLIPDTSTGRNELVTIPVLIDNPDSLAGAEFTIGYDPDILTALNVQTTSLTSGFTFTDSINNSTGRITCALARANAIQSTSSGSLVDISFCVNSDANDNDTCSLTLSNVLLSDENSIPISANVSNGLFTVLPSAQESPVRIEISVINDTLLVDDEREIYATGYDQFEKPVIINPDWSVTGAIGTVNPTYGDTVTFTAVNPGIGLIIATLDTLSDSGSILVCKKGNIFDPSDTTIDVRDAVYCLRISEGLIHASPIQIRIADMNNDETVDVADALLILQESLKRLMAAKIGHLAKTSQQGLAKVNMINLNNQAISINVTERTDICGASLSFSYDSTQVEIVEILPGNPNALIVSNTLKAGKVKVGLISLDGLINAQDQLIKIRVKTKTYGEPKLSLDKIKIYDVKAQPIEIEEFINTIEHEMEIPTEFSLHQNYPNPFNPTTTIRCDLPEPANVKIEIYNILGARVKTLVSGTIEAGVYSTLWNGKNDYGHPVSSGIYIYRIFAVSESNKLFVDIKTMLLIK